MERLLVTSISTFPTMFSNASFPGLLKTSIMWHRVNAWLEIEVVEISRFNAVENITGERRICQ